MEGRDTTTTNLAKVIFQPKNDYELRIKDNFIRARLKKWTKFGILEKRENEGKTFYTVKPESIFIGDATLVVETQNETAVLELGKGILFKTNDTWFLYEYKS